MVQLLIRRIDLQSKPNRNNTPQIYHLIMILEACALAFGKETAAEIIRIFLLYSNRSLSDFICRRVISEFKLTFQLQWPGLYRFNSFFIEYGVLLFI